MKRIISLLYISALFLGIVSCDNEDKKEVVTGPQVTTLEAVQGSILMATLSGRVSGVESVALDFQCGIECSTDESFSQDKTTRVKFPSKYSEEPYSIAIAVQPGKKYYYRAYYINQLLIYYGEIKTFSFNWDAPQVETISADCKDDYTVTFTGYIKDLSKIEESLANIPAVAPDLDMEFWHFGLQYSTSENFGVEDTHAVFSSLASNDTITGVFDAYYMGILRLEEGATYYYRTYFNLGGIKSYGQIKTFVFNFEWEPEYVDLGLGVKWATCNIGAHRPEFFGDFFAWGEIEPKDEYTWDNYKYGEESEKLTKYCSDKENGFNEFTDNKKKLDIEDDAAHILWGGDWRIPTYQDFVDLITNCTQTPETVGLFKCVRFTSNVSGYTDKSILLPVAIYGESPIGFYCTSELDADYITYSLFLSSSSGSIMGYTRQRPQSIRPVCP